MNSKKTGKIKHSSTQKEKQNIPTAATTITIAVVAFAALAIGSLGGSAYGQPANRPVDPPNPEPPGQQLTSCPDGFELVDRNTCEGEPRLECEPPSRPVGDGTCELIETRTPVCPVGLHLSEDGRVCLDDDTNEETAVLPLCNEAIRFFLSRSVDGSWECVRRTIIDPTVPVCDIGKLNEETGMCEVRPTKGNRP